MKDAFGIPQSLLVLGGTSEIALATARRLITRRTRTVWLAGRPAPALEEAAERLRGSARTSVPSPSTPSIPSPTRPCSARSSPRATSTWC